MGVFMKKSEKELELLILESISFNEETLETLEMLADELNTSFCLNISIPSVVAH